MPENVRQELVEGVKALENVPEHLKDWHPGSGKQVLDLVHPSLYCYVQGVTKEVKEWKEVPWNEVTIFVRFSFCLGFSLKAVSSSSGEVR